MAKVAEEYRRYAESDPEALAKRIDSLEKRMHQHAQNLEFEEAAKLRDEARRLRELGLQALPEEGVIGVASS